MKMNLNVDDAKVVLFSDSSMNMGSQELQALQQMRSLNSLGYKTILLCKPKSAISVRARSDGIEVQEIPFRNAFCMPSLKQLFNLVKEKPPVTIFCHGTHDALMCALVGMVQAFRTGQRALVFRVKTFQHGTPYLLRITFFFRERSFLVTIYAHVF